MYLSLNIAHYKVVSPTDNTSLENNIIYFYNEYMIVIKYFKYFT